MAEPRQASQSAAAVQGMMLPRLALAKAIRDSVEAKQAGESDADLVELLALAQPGELIKLAQSTAHSVTILMQAERLARGEPIEIVRTQGEMVSLDVQITPAEISATADILKEAGGPWFLQTPGEIAHLASICQSEECATHGQVFADGARVADTDSMHRTYIGLIERGEVKSTSTPACASWRGSG